MARAAVLDVASLSTGQLDKHFPIKKKFRDGQLVETWVQAMRAFSYSSKPIMPEALLALLAARGIDVYEIFGVVVGVIDDPGYATVRQRVERAAATDATVNCGLYVGRLGMQEFPGSFVDMVLTEREHTVFHGTVGIRSALFYYSFQGCGKGRSQLLLLPPEQ